MWFYQIPYAISLGDECQVKFCNRKGTMRVNQPLNGHLPLVLVDELVSHTKDTEAQ